jgi:hypothetical protein
MADDDVSLQHMITKKVISNLNVLRPRVLYRVLRDFDGTLVVAQQRYFLQVDPVVLERLLHPKELTAASSSNNVFGFSSGE